MPIGARDALYHDEYDGSGTLSFLARFFGGIPQAVVGLDLSRESAVQIHTRVQKLEKKEVSALAIASAKPKISHLRLLGPLHAMVVVQAVYRPERLTMALRARGSTASSALGELTPSSRAPIGLSGGAQAEANVRTLADVTYENRVLWYQPVLRFGSPESTVSATTLSQLVEDLEFRGIQCERLGAVVLCRPDPSMLGVVLDYVEATGALELASRAQVVAKMRAAALVDPVEIARVLRAAGISSPNRIEASAGPANRIPERTAAECRQNAKQTVCRKGWDRFVAPRDASTPRRESPHVGQPEAEI